MRGAGLGIGVWEEADNLFIWPRSAHAVSVGDTVSPNAEPRSSDKSDPDLDTDLKDRVK